MRKHVRAAIVLATAAALSLGSGAYAAELVSTPPVPFDAKTPQVDHVLNCALKVPADIPCKIDSSQPSLPLPLPNPGTEPPEREDPNLGPSPRNPVESLIVVVTKTSNDADAINRHGGLTQGLVLSERSYFVVWVPNELEEAKVREYQADPAVESASSEVPIDILEQLWPASPA